MSIFDPVETDAATGVVRDQNYIARGTKDNQGRPQTAFSKSNTAYGYDELSDDAKRQYDEWKREDNLRRNTASRYDRYRYKEHFEHWSPISNRGAAQDSADMAAGHVATEKAAQARAQARADAEKLSLPKAAGYLDQSRERAAELGQGAETRSDAAGQRADRYATDVRATGRASDAGYMRDLRDGRGVTAPVMPNYAEARGYEPERRTRFNDARNYFSGAAGALKDTTFSDVAGNIATGRSGAAHALATQGAKIESSLGPSGAVAGIGGEADWNRQIARGEIAGPSVAVSQLAGGRDRAIENAMAVASSGARYNPAAMRSAAIESARQQQQFEQGAAQLRAQEQATAAGRVGQLLDAQSQRELAARRQMGDFAVQSGQQQLQAAQAGSGMLSQRASGYGQIGQAVQGQQQFDLSAQQLAQQRADQTVGTLNTAADRALRGRQLDDAMYSQLLSARSADEDRALRGRQLDDSRTSDARRETLDWYRAAQGGNQAEITAANALHAGLLGEKQLQIQSTPLPEKPKKGGGGILSGITGALGAGVGFLTGGPGGAAAGWGAGRQVGGIVDDGGYKDDVRAWQRDYDQAVADRASGFTV